jgi:hypothetical protein
MFTLSQQHVSIWTLFLTTISHNILNWSIWYLTDRFSKPWNRRWTKKIICFGCELLKIVLYYIIYIHFVEYYTFFFIMNINTLFVIQVYKDTICKNWNSYVFGFETFKVKNVYFITATCINLNIVLNYNIT